MELSHKCSEAELLEDSRILSSFKVWLLESTAHCIQLGLKVDLWVLHPVAFGTYIWHCYFLSELD